MAVKPIHILGGIIFVVLVYAVFATVISNQQLEKQATPAGNYWEPPVCTATFKCLSNGNVEATWYVSATVRNSDGSISRQCQFGGKSPIICVWPSWCKTRNTWPQACCAIAGVCVSI